MASAEDVWTLRIVYAKEKLKLEVDPSMTVQTLKDKISDMTHVPGDKIKLMHKGLLAGPGKPELENRSLVEAKLANKAQILVVGATSDAVKSVEQVDALAKTGALKQTEQVAAAAAARKTPWATETKHKRILDRGVPDDAPLAFLPGADPLPDAPISGMLDGSGEKVRLHFSLTTNELIISTKRQTRRVPLSKIQQIKSEPIPSLEHYHILAIQMGSTAQSTYFVYYFPAQYVASAKGCVFGGLM
ncbi:uncharacterized protein MONBRDRAFT_32939 [Monosiga brevicollis MX1]|uniref:Ubiquitin-like domain-containing protein n=1 Tax=Monosiga brevicollis TaxID=81824 RepID=A9V2N0_MONBE|nr:uncharacterized protein MONBRDRAFT_32939 [Monosiga brevicollis MX1]EDQ88404.1 predicted protein [Monosiga brevicollis MX1]|eukprot:XP_001746997.1 hypothetical protein [Monosiga brevicollis MX1]